MPRPELRQFLLFVFVLLLPCFALWSFLSAAIITPVIGLAHLILSNWFPDIVNVIHQQGADALLMTRLDEVSGQLVTTAANDAGLGFSINTRIVSYSIPFYAALHFATARTGYLASFCWGLLVLYPFILVGLLSICLKDLVISFGPRFLEQPGAPGAGTIGIAYQMSVLIVPTLLPVLVWAWQSRDTTLLRGLLRQPTAPGEINP
jgi:hypothetical protein